MHAGDQRPGRAVFEVRQVKPQQVSEYLAAEHRVDAIAGVQHQVLAQPAHAGAERHEHGEPHRDHDERALRLMHHHLVDDDLGENRRGERDELDEERGEKHVAPDAPMAQKLVPEPAEAELRLGRRAVLAQRLGFFVPDQERPRLETLLYVGCGAGLRRLAACLEVKQPFTIGPDDDGGALLLEEGKAGKSGSSKRAFAGAKSQRFQSF